MREDTSAPGDAPSLIVFDLDGTLADSQAGVLHSFARTLADYGRSASDETLRDLIGPPLSVSFARLGFVGDDIDIAVARYRSYYDRDGVDMSFLYEGVASMLATLHSRGVELTVATSKRVDFARRMVGNLGIAEYFAVICGAALDGSLNTKREVLDETLHLVRARPSHDVWMVGDRREDMGAAIALDVVPVGALWGYGSRAELEDGGASMLFAGPADLVRALYPSR